MTFLNEDDHTGWNAEFSFYYSDIKSDLDSKSQNKNVKDGSVPNCVVMAPARKLKSKQNVTDEDKLSESGAIGIKHKHLLNEIERRDKERRWIKANNYAFCLLNLGTIL